MRTEAELAQIRLEAEAELKKYPGVLGLCFGLKQVGDATVNEFALCVYVEEKKSLQDLAPENVLPKEFKGLPTDVMTLPTITPGHCIDIDTHSPIISGITITNFKSNSPEAGTLGFFATINGMSGPENVALVSNHHVLRANGAGVGDEIYQPKSQDVGGNVTFLPKESSTIGKIHSEGLDGDHDFTYPGETNQIHYYLDCAAAKVDVSISSWCHTNCGTKFKNQIRLFNHNNSSAISGIGRVRDEDISDPNHPYIVYKVGRQSGLTVGKVTKALALSQGGTGIVIKIEVISMDPGCKAAPGDPDTFMLHGDSGSPLVNDKNELIGLLYGLDHTDSRFAYACHIHPVLDFLKVTAITEANPHSAASTLSNLPGLIGDSEVDHTQQLKGNFLNTERGKELFALVYAHRMEVVELVNRRRPVTVAWRRNQGPLFLSHLLNNARDPEHVIPREIEGVTRETLITKLATALMAHGSAALKAVIEKHLQETLALADQFDNLHELVKQFETLSQHE